MESKLRTLIQSKEAIAHSTMYDFCLSHCSGTSCPKPAAVTPARPPPLPPSLVALSQLSPLSPLPPLPFLPSSLVQSLSGGDQNGGGGLSILLAPSLSHSPLVALQFGVSLSERALCAPCNCCFSLPSKCSDRIDAEDGKVSM